MPNDVCLFLSTEKWNFESAFIRRGTNCAWSHAGWYVRSKRMTFSAMADGRGLAWRTVRPRQQVLLLDAPGAEQSLSLALQLEGTPYDYLDILGIIFGRNWSLPGHLICDVAVFRFQEQAGFGLVNPRFIPRIHLTPRDILLSPAVTLADSL